MADAWAALLATAAWLGVHLVIIVRFLDSRRLEEHSADAAPNAPLVSVIIPARNEAHNIARCLRSVLASRYPALDVLVVNDHSTDGTGEIARAIAVEDATARPDGRSRVRVLEAPELPEGWFGKQWACHTGASAAQGALLLFTDADTAHGPELLSRSVNAMQARGADLFTVAGHQDAHTFWEKVVQPFVFAILLSRYGGTERMSRSTRPLEKIANGQYLLMTREAYTRVGGHESVRAHVAEDLRLAQRMTELGLSVQMMLAQHHLSTRMYTSLAEIRRGWGKNVYAAGRDTLPLNAVTRRILPFIFPLPGIVPVLPLIVLLLACLGIGREGALIFGALASAISFLFWMAVYGYARLNPLWGLLYPLGALTFAGICAESAWRGSRVQWKGRNYISRSQ